MKKLGIFILGLLALYAFTDKSSFESENLDGVKFRSINNRVFSGGERLKYLMHYGPIDAGIMEIQVKSHKNKIAGREVYHVVGTGETQGVTDWVFRVRDRYETYLDKYGVFPWAFVRRVDEGGYIINQDYTFKQHKKQVDNGKGKTFTVPENVQDMISAFYYARTIDYSKAKPGQIFTIEAFVDDEVWPLKLKYAGKVHLKMNGQYYRCMKFHPVVQEGRIFKKEEDLSVWISDDGNKIPLMAQAKILVGSIKMELIEYEGLSNPLAVIKK